eukprot:GGOE01019963.1.p1 GENE.GGOE01019963.1~~GGOE01019963.1.p1  ORF type:complete len:298 (-),score=61.41 GGOE01019963.1:607-1500(-)
MLPVRPWRSELRRKQRDKERRLMYDTVDYKAYLQSNPVVRKLANTENAVIRQRRHMPLARSELSSEHANGIRTVRDKHDANQLIKEFDLIPPNRVEDRGHDFIRLNKKSQGKATTARTVHSYRKANDIRLWPRSAVQLEQRRLRARSLPTEGRPRPSTAQQRAMEMVHGEPVFRDVTMADLIRNGFQFDWVKEQAWRQEQKARREQREQQRLEEGLQRLKLLRGQAHGPMQGQGPAAASPEAEESSPGRGISADQQISQFARKFRAQIALQKTITSEAIHPIPTLVADSLQCAAATP